MTKWPNHISPRDARKLDEHLTQLGPARHVRLVVDCTRKPSADHEPAHLHGDSPITYRPVDRDHAPLDIVQGVEVHRMPAEASTDIGAEPDEPDRFGALVVPLAILAAVAALGLCWALYLNALPGWLL